MTEASLGQHGRDHDGSDEEFLLGITNRDWLGVGDGSFVFLETIREHAADHPNIPFEQHIGENLAHEVGHQFGLNHKPDGPESGWRGYYSNLLYLMAGEADFDDTGKGYRDEQTFEPRSLRDIRSIDHPIMDAL